MRALRVFLFVIRVIGKILFKIWNFRKKKALLALSKLVGMIKAWINRRKAKYRNISINFIESVAAKDKIVKLMYEWRRKITFIQRNFRSLLKTKNIIWSYRLLFWDKLESKTLTKKKITTGPRKTLSFKGKIIIKNKRKTVTKASVPHEVKIRLIKEFLLEKIRLYHSQLKIHKETCKAKISEYKQTYYRKQSIAALNKTAVEELILPEKPVLNCEMNEQNIRKLITKAFEIEKYWEDIVNEYLIKQKYYNNYVKHNKYFNC